MIIQGKIKGNMMSLRLRAMAQKKFYSLGVFLQCNNGKVLFIGLLLLSLCCVGLKNQIYDTDIQNLWFEGKCNFSDEKYFNYFIICFFNYLILGYTLTFLLFFLLIIINSCHNIYCIFISCYGVYIYHSRFVWQTT